MKSNLVSKTCRYFYKKIQRKRLKVNGFSIISNSCIGGQIYHDLGLKFLSPTINIQIHDVDFYKFVVNLKEYLNYELRFIQTQEQYPIAFLGDIKLYFVHYKTEEEAASKWYERCKRINWDKLYIICSDRPCGKEVSHEDMLSLKNVKCANKAIFSTRKYDDIDYIVQLPKDPEGDYVNKYMLDKIPIINFWRYEFLWDYVKWLNNGKEY